MMSDVFTNIPLIEMIDLAIEAIFTGKPMFTMTKTDLKQLFLIAKAQTHFLFDGKFYDLTDGVAMGSPLAPILANFFSYINKAHTNIKFSFETEKQKLDILLTKSHDTYTTSTYHKPTYTGLLKNFFS